MSDAAHGHERPAGQALINKVRVDRWDEARKDVPDGYGEDEILRSIAADARRASDSLKTIAGWSTVAGLCVIVITIVVLVLALGGVTLTFEIA